MTFSYCKPLQMACRVLMALAASSAVAYGEEAIQIISRDGVVRNPAIQNYGVHKTNGALHFDGKTSRISFPYRDDLGDKTLWVRFRNSEPSGGGQFRIVLSNTDTGNPSWGFTIHTGWCVIMARICDAQKQGQMTICRPKDINAWHEVCLTYQASIGIVRLYVDGQSQDIAELKGYTPASPDQLVWLGWDRSDSGSYFSGDMSKVRIFERCLSDKEIAQMSNRVVPDEIFTPIDPKTLPAELAFQRKPVNPGKNIDWLKRNKARIVCGVDNNGGADAAAVDRFSKAGFNVMMTNGFNAAPESYFNATSSTVVQVAKRCSELGIKAIPYYWFTPGFFTHRHYQKEAPVLQSKYVDRSGIQRYAPCPINRQYWDSCLRQGMVQTARLSKEYPIVAIAIDFELYETDIPSGFGHCFCDACWGQFCRGTKIDGYGIPPAQRYLYLAEHKLIERYVEWQSKELWKLGAWLAQSVHEINPDLALAYINYDRSWFAKNVTQGFAADGIPAMAFHRGTQLCVRLHPESGRDVQGSQP